MRKWDYVCNEFKRVREMIDKDIRTPQHCLYIMAQLEACCSELTPDNRQNWDYYDNFRDMRSEIHDEIEYMDETDYETCERTVNNFLEEFYDLCDEANVFLAL